MPSQNINSYYYPKYRTKLNYGHYFDLTLASDERGYDEEVVFSNKLIGEDDGNRLPIFLDLNNSLTSTKPFINFGDYISGNTLVSKNYYNPNNVDLTCLTGYSSTCDIGLVGTDNGLYTELTGQTLQYSMGVDDTHKFDPHYRDRRFKMHPVTGHTQPPNVVFSGRPKNSIYNIVYKSDPTIGYYQELYGGFYQGFYKLNGYDYEVFPERINKGWSVEMVLKPRTNDEYFIDNSTEVYLNGVYPNNSGTFFYFGARAENKFYHDAEGSPNSDSGYTRNTNDLTCLLSCACSDTGVTNANCVDVYPSSGFTTIHNVGCDCGCASTQRVPLPETDPMFDVLSNALSFRFKGCAENPSIGVKYIKITGSCVTTGTCETTGTTFQTGYTITEVFSEPIYDICGIECGDLIPDRWVMVSAVFERYRTIEDCDLQNLGGLNDMRTVTTQSSLDGNSYNLISPPQTHTGSILEPEIHKINFKTKWFDDLKFRLGTLKLYVNGYLFMVIEDFEEIIPRELNTEKEKQVGVPFNISFGGGTQGLHDHLIFSGCSQPNGAYTQDPELFPNNILSGTTLSGLSTNILLEENFGGTFMGGISQFRMYTEPLDFTQIQHNTRLLKDKFGLFDYYCPSCYDGYIVLNIHTVVTVYSGSIISNITVNNDFPVPADTTVGYDVTLNVISGSPITLKGEIIIPKGQMTASKLITIDDSYDRLVNDATMKSPFVTMGNNNIRVNHVIEQDMVVYESPVLPKPTPVPTSTPTTTPVTTPTGTLTPTPTGTLTPTPTPTPMLGLAYYGKINKKNITQTDVGLLDELLTNDILSTHINYVDEQGYCYLLIPETFAQPETFRDSEEGCDGFIIPFIQTETLNISDDFGNVIIYYVYRSFVSTYSSVDVWVCN